MSDFDYVSDLGLTVVGEAEFAKVYRLEKPGTRINSCQICFTAEGISICGDLSPGGNRGVHSDFGYGVGWFASRLSLDYLCSKFLPQDYYREYGMEHVKYLLDNADEFEFSESDVERLRGVTEDDIASHDDFYYLMQEIGHCDVVTDGAGVGYSPRDAALLIAIQKRFSELYNARQEMVAKDS